jgi:hypothetical protein
MALKSNNMTEETKKQLMQYVYKLAAHYEIPNAELVSFKKRNVVLELLSTKAPDAHKVVSELIDASLKLERIQNDKEKQAKKPDHWNEEVVATQAAVELGLEVLLKFMKNKGIA